MLSCEGTPLGSCVPGGGPEACCCSGAPDASPAPLALREPGAVAGSYCRSRSRSRAFSSRSSTTWAGGAHGAAWWVA